MKSQFIRTLLLLSLIFIVYSCEKDEKLGGQGDPESHFLIHIDRIQSGYIMATSPSTGNVLFSDDLINSNDSIIFDAGGSETVDITYAYEYNTGFNVTTFRDVKSGFKFSGYTYSCYDGQFSYDDIFGKAEIVFPGTKEIEKVINPAFDRSDLQETSNTTIDNENKIIYDLDNDVTIIKAFLGSTGKDLQFVFRFIGEQEYKSIIIKREDWVKVDEDNYKVELEIEDLSLCKAHEIEVGVDQQWIVNSEVLTSSGERVTIAQWSNYSQNQKGETIRLFLQENIEVDQLLLKLNSNSTYKGYQFHKGFNGIPTSISLKEYFNEVSDVTPNTYNYSTNENFDIVKASYQYLIDNHISSWKIYQKSNSTSDYTLPLFESEFLDETTLIKTSLMSPSRFFIQFYSLEMPVDQVFYETGIDQQLNCLNFDSSYDSYEF